MKEALRIIIRRFERRPEPLNTELLTPPIDGTGVSATEILRASDGAAGATLEGTGISMHAL